jgi:hypothetical protein
LLPEPSAKLHLNPLSTTGCNKNTCMTVIKLKVYQILQKIMKEVSYLNMNCKPKKPPK